MMQVSWQLKRVPPIFEKLAFDPTSIRYRENQPTVIATPSPELPQRIQRFMQMLQDHPPDNDVVGKGRIAGSLQKHISDLVACFARLACSVGRWLNSFDVPSGHGHLVQEAAGGATQLQQ